MNTRLAVFATLCVCVMAFQTFAAEQVGFVLSVTGDAVAMNQADQERKLLLKEPVFMHDKLVTRSGGRFQVMFNDDSILSGGENSEVIIDEYVYSPDKKEENRYGLKMLKGVMRVITGKIAELNPDRFKVETRMATIGIRGCDVGFRLTGNNENIYVMRLPQGKSIEIVRTSGDPGGPGQVIRVEKQNMMVLIQPGRAMTMRRIRQGEFDAIISENAPEQVDSEEPEGGPGEGEGDADADGYGSFESDDGVWQGPSQEMGGAPVGVDRIQTEASDVGGVIGDRIDVVLDAPSPVLPPDPPTPDPDPPTPTPTPQPQQMIVSGKALGAEFNTASGYYSLSRKYLYGVSGEIKDGAFNGTAAGNIMDRNGVYLGAKSTALKGLPIVPYGSASVYEGYTEVAPGISSIQQALETENPEMVASANPALMAYDNLAQFFRYVNPEDSTCAFVYGGYASSAFGATLPADALLKYDIKYMSYKKDYFFGTSPDGARSSIVWINTKTGAFMTDPLEKSDSRGWGYIDELEFFGQGMQGVGTVFSIAGDDEKDFGIAAGFRDPLYLGKSASGTFKYAGYGVAMLLKTLEHSTDIGVKIYRSANELSDSFAANEGQFGVAVDRGAHKNNVSVQARVYQNPNAPVESDLVMNNPTKSVYVKGKDFAAFWDNDAGGLEFHTIGGGEDWTWGRWNRDNVGVSQETETGLGVGHFKGVFVVGETLGSSAYQALANGPQSYSLSTSANSPGRAAAFYSYGYNGGYMSGPCNISVLIPGNGSAATWSGSFSLTAPHGTRVDSLDFNMNGTISANGHLAGKLGSYQLVIDGANYSLNSLSSQRATGALVGKGLGTRPISGAIGQFHFDHANSSGTPKVSGIYGTDIQ